MAAQIIAVANGKKKYLGYFKDEIEAALAYDDAAGEAWPGYAWLNHDNFPEVAERYLHQEKQLMVSQATSTA